MKTEKYSKALFLICGLILVIVGVPRLFLNDWIIYSNYLFYTAAGFFLLGAVLNYKTVLEFFSMRTTKYGLNMGTLIFLGLVLYLCVNFFAFRYDKSIDITGDKINSLSLQSLEVLDGLKEDVELLVYYQGRAHTNENMGLKSLFKKYIRESDKIKTSFVDAHKDPTSSKYLTREDQGKIVVFARKGPRVERIRGVIGEESITSALFRLEQTQSKRIYFLAGHGERGFQNSAASGSSVKILAESLRSKGFVLETLNLLQELKGVPEDAAMIAILGPKKALLDQELKSIKKYLLDGGRLLLATDPSQQSNLDELAALVGIEIQKNYLLATQTLAGADAMSVLGQKFDAESPITSDFEGNAITLFYEVSGLKKVKNKFKLSELVKTPQIVIPVVDLENYKVEIEGKSPEVATIAMMAQGTFGEDAHEGHGHDALDLDQKQFLMAVFGDSDFLSDLYLETGFNKDLALNTFAEISGQTNLISIRPRTAKDTKLILTESNSAFVVIFPILIPLFLLIAAVILWFRKRGA